MATKIILIIFLSIVIPNCNDKVECNKNNALELAKCEYEKVLSKEAKRLFLEQGKYEIEDSANYFEIKLYITSDSIPPFEWMGGEAYFKISKDDCNIIEKKFYQ